jgi:heat shock protein HtpX
MAKNIYSSISENRLKVIALCVAFPIMMAALIAGVFSAAYGIRYLSAGDFPVQQQQIYSEYLYFLEGDLQLIIGASILAGLIWVIIAYFTGSSMILKAAGTRKANPKDLQERQLIKLVENVSITAGIKAPELYIINDESCNAFATGSSPNKSSVTFTTGIIKKLNKQELEGVVAHEISHIINYDVRTMLLMISCIGFCTFVGEFLLRSLSRSRGGKDSGQIKLILLILGLAFLIFGYIFAPLMRLAVSRKQEYRADANAALLTRNPLALASALEKISVDARVEALDSQKLASSICIANPQDKKSGGFFAFMAGLGRTHPPIKDRVKCLQQMGM